MIIGDARRAGRLHGSIGFLADWARLISVGVLPRQARHRERRTTEMSVNTWLILFVWGGPTLIGVAIFACSEYSRSRTVMSDSDEQQAEFTWESFPASGQATFVHFATGVWQWLSKQEAFGNCIHPRSPEQMTRLIAYAYHASLQVEEGRAVRFRLVFSPPQEQITLRFGKSLDYDVSSLVKIAPTIELHNLYLVVQPAPEDQDALQIVGISNPEFSPQQGSDESPWFRDEMYQFTKLHALRVSAHGPGHIRMQTTQHYLFDFYAGSIRFPVSPLSIKRFGEMHSAAARMSLTQQSAPADRVADFGGIKVTDGEQFQLQKFANLSLALWMKILDRVVRAKHGGSFVVVPTTFDPGLIAHKYELNSRAIIDAISERSSLQPDLFHESARKVKGISLAENAVKANRKLSEVEYLVASLASVDGAVIVGADLTILGFGATLKPGPDKDRQHEIVFAQHTGWKGLPEDRRALSLFGTRHTSAVHFCEDVPEAIAFVISQDGALRIFWNDGGDVRGAEASLDIGSR